MVKPLKQPEYRNIGESHVELKTLVDSNARKIIFVKHFLFVREFLRERDRERLKGRDNRERDNT